MALPIHLDPFMRRAIEKRKSELRQPVTAESVLSKTGYGMGDLSDPIQRQLQQVVAGGNKDDIKAFQKTLGSIVSQEQQFQPYQQMGMGQAGALQGYSQAGSDALAQQQALLGLKGQGAMERAYNENPAQAFARKQMEQSLLRNSAATGGLRGSGVQRELAELTSGLTSQNIQQQLAQLGQLSGRGQQAATGLFNTGYDASQSLANIYGTGHADLAGMSAGYGEQRARSKSGSGIGGLVGGLAGSMFGGIGSSLGASLGSSIGKKFGL